MHDYLASDGGEPELFVSTPARGAHELIVHTPKHLTAMSDLAPEQFALAVATWRERMALHAPDAAYVHLIVNEGRPAGASLEHTHAQLFALPFVPAAVARERERFTTHNTRTGGGGLLCDLLQKEMRLHKRVVAVNAQEVLLAPYASSMAYQLQLVPRAHAPSLTEADTPAVAALLLEGLSRLRRRLESPPPLNLWLRTAPAGAEHFHWYIAIVPRLAQPAGLELGAGVGMNVYPPERVAADLGET